MLTLPVGEAPEISIVIVTTRRPERLRRCLEAVVAGAAGAPSYEVVIVLNAADPALGECLADAVTGARVLRSGLPLGFGGGANLGTRHARGRLLHLLHDDTEVCPGWLTALTNALDQHPEAGAVGSLVLDMHSGRAQTAGHVLWSDGTTGPRWPDDSPELGQFTGPYPVDYCASASLLVRRAAWQAVDGFDQRFHPAYYVDVDFAMSLRACGYTVICEPASRVRHQRGGSGGPGVRTFVSERNRERFCAKWAAGLAYQEPPGTRADALERSFRATERRAAAVAAAGHRSAPEPVQGPADDDEDEVARLRRERALLLRDIEVKDGFIEQAERLLADASATRELGEAEGMRAQRALAEGHEAAVELHRAYGELAAAHDALAARNAAAEVELRGLRMRSATLEAIEAGGWWRLRARVLPLLALGRRARAAGRHRA